MHAPIISFSLKRESKLRIFGKSRKSTLIFHFQFSIFNFDITTSRRAVYTGIENPVSQGGVLFGTFRAPNIRSTRAIGVDGRSAPHTETSGLQVRFVGPMRRISRTKQEIINI